MMCHFRCKICLKAEVNCHPAKGAATEIIKGNVLSRPPRQEMEKGAAAKPIVQGLPVVRAHVDYTLRSGQERLKALLPDEWEKLQKTPYGIIQVLVAQASSTCRLHATVLHGSGQSSRACQSLYRHV